MKVLSDVAKDALELAPSATFYTANNDFLRGHKLERDPLYADYDRLLDIARRHDLVLSLGDALRRSRQGAPGPRVGERDERGSVRRARGVDA